MFSGFSVNPEWCSRIIIWENAVTFTREDDTIYIYPCNLELDGAGFTQVLESGKVSITYNGMKDQETGMMIFILQTNYRIRKNLLSLDEVMNEQRECIYRERDRVLSGIGIEESLRKTMKKIIDDSLGKHKDEQERIEHITTYLPVARYYFHLAGNLRKNLYQAVEDLYQEKEKELGNTDAMRNVAQMQLLRIMDRYWMDQIHRLELLKEGISLQSYAQRDPIIIYKEETYLAFDEMIDCTRKEWIRVLFQYHYVNGARFKI